MAYASDETSAASGRPIELYTFVGTNTTWRLTSYQQEIVSNGNTFTPETIERNSIKVNTHDESDNAIEVGLPVDHPIVDQYAFKVSPPSLMLTLQRCHESDPDDVVNLWYGPIISYSVQKRLAKLKVPDLFSYSIQNTIPRARYQAPCNHVLYDNRCGVNSASYSSTRTVSAINGNQITLDSSPFADGACNGGMMEFSDGSENRMIVSNTGTSFLVSYPFADLSVSDTVVIYQGCDRSFSTCKSKFSNGANFGGFPYVPQRNPFTTKI